MNEDVISSTVPSYPIQEEKSDEQQAIEHEQVQEDYHLAALKDHPGWIQIRTQMLQDIDEFKSFAHVKMAEYSNSELGEVVRTERMVADKLQGYVNKIDEAVKAVVVSHERNGK